MFIWDPKKIPCNRIFLITEIPCIRMWYKRQRRGKSGPKQRFLITGNSFYPWFLVTGFNCTDDQSDAASPRIFTAGMKR